MQINLLQKSNEGLVSERDESRKATAAMKKTALKGEVLAAVMASVPDPTFHGLAADSLDSFLSSALDGDVDMKDVVAKAVERLKARAPQILEAPKPGAMTHGIIPSDTGARAKTQSEALAEQQAELAKFGFKNPLAVNT